MCRAIFLALIGVTAANLFAEPVSSATVDGIVLDTVVATNSMVTLGQYQYSLPLEYSTSIWNEADPAYGTAAISVNDEACFEAEVSEGTFVWEPEKAGRYVLKLTAGSFTYQKTVQVNAPTVSFAREGYSSCKLTASDGVSPIRYTTDGSDPTESSTLYTGPFEISPSEWTTVKARTFGEGYLPGEVYEAMFGKAGSVVSSAETSCAMDNSTGVKSVGNEQLSLPYDVTWEGDASSKVILSADGVTFAERSGAGTVDWMPLKEGETTLSLKILSSLGELIEEYTADFYVYPSEITITNGLIPLKNQLSGGIDCIRKIVIPDSIAELCENFFEGCSGLKDVMVPIALLQGNIEQAPQVEKNSWILGEDGVYQSNDINDSESTSMTLEVEGPCDFTFDWKVSSEGYCDNLKWYLDDSQISEISGTGSGWQTVSYSIPEGSHTIRWEYSKDGSVSDGDDCGWVRFTESMNASVRMSNLFPDSYTAITNVVLTGEGERIPSYAFAGCTSLENVEIPESVTHIGTGAFNGCSSLTSVTIPDAVTSIGSSAFSDCNSLKSVAFYGEMPSGISASGILSNADSVRYYREYASSYEEIVPASKFGGYLPESVDEFLNMPGNVFTQSDERPWIIDTKVSSDGEGSMRSGKIGVNESTWIETVINGPGKLTYKWKSSSEYYEDESEGIYEIYDYGYLSVDNEAMGGLNDEYALEGVAIGGHTDWQDMEFDVTGEGEHTLRWTYLKDQYDDEQMTGEDCIWVDQIKFRPYVTLSFDLGGGVGETPRAIYELHESKITLPADAGFTRDNHVFDGWCDGKLKYAAGEMYEMPRTNVTLRAQWIEKRALSFDLGGGEGVAPDVIKNIPDTVITLPDTAGFDRAKYTFTGWSDGVRMYAAGASYTIGVEDVVFTAQWRANTISTPVISSRDIANGGVLNTASATISISADSGASVYYTLDGSTPNAASTKYTVPFVADGLGCVTIKAIALRDNYFDSEVATFSFIRRPYSAAECLGVNGFAVVTEGDNAWFRVQGDSAHDGESALQSGAIGEGGSSVIEMTVYGKGTISFWWKSSSHDGNRNRKYDYVSFEVDDLGEQAWLGGEKDWVNVTYDVTDEGAHTLKWIYKKNSDGIIAGNDCAWLDEVVWTPAGAIPELGTGASSEMITLVLSGAADAKLAANIKTAAEYAAYRTWALGLEGVTSDAVKSSPNAWLSFALDTDALITAAQKEGDVVIDTFESAATDGAFEFTVKIDGVEVGKDALEANIRKVFDIEGAENLAIGEAGFSPDNVEVNAAAPENGNVKFTVTPKMGNGEKPKSFFFRVKMK